MRARAATIICGWHLRANDWRTITRSLQMIVDTNRREQARAKRAGNL